MIFLIPTKESQRKSCSVLKLIFEAARRESFDNDDYHLRTLVVQVSWSTFRKIFAVVRIPNTFIFVTSENADQPGRHRLLLCNRQYKYLSGTYLNYQLHYGKKFAIVFLLSTWSVLTHERFIAIFIFPFMWTFFFILIAQYVFRLYLCPIFYWRRVPFSQIFKLISVYSLIFNLLNNLSEKSFVQNTLWKQKPLLHFKVYI